VLPTPARTLILGALVSVVLPLTSSAASAEAALLVDADSGRVLYAENATQPWYPASVTKIMTTYVILKAVKEGRLSFDKLFTVSENAAAQQPSKMGFPVGTQVTVDNALKMLMVHSANDMAVVLAEGLSGSIENFATEMNRAAERLGMTQTSYVNPNGLPADGQITSARDLAILARAAIREMPEYDLYWHISAIKFGKRIMRNYNALIDRYPGADGMKTGFICASGYNLVATATRGSRRLIAVILGARSGMQRAEKAAQLLERGFTGAGGLTWLLPAFGTVDSLKPIDAAPVNLRDEICNGKGRRKPHSDSDEEAAGNGADEPGSPLAMMAGFQLGPAKPGPLLGPLEPSMAPIVVYTGPTRSPGAVELASTPAPKKKPRKPSVQTAATPGQPAAGATNGHTGANGASAPKVRRASASSDSASKPAGETKPSSDAAQAAKPKPKPKPKPVAAKQPNNG
jgi:D-alanyl-D-alanine carboxypeptidase